MANIPWVRTRAALCAASAFAVVSAANASLPQRTFVATTGSDSAPSCSIAAPCRSFATALAKTADGGEIVVLDSGGYGPVTIGQSVAIVAPAGVYAGVSVPPAADGVVINGLGVKVILHGLAVNGQGGNNGINFVQGARLSVENAAVTNMAANGILHAASGGDLVVTDSLLRDNAQHGLLAFAAGKTVVARTRAEKNGWSGIAIAYGARAAISDATIVHNGQSGIVAAADGGLTTTLDVERTLLGDNAFDGINLNSQTAASVLSVTVRRSTVVRNGLNGITVGSNSATTLATIADSVITDNLVDGVRSTGPGARAHVTANTLSWNGIAGLHQIDAGVMVTRNNNGIEWNGTGVPAVGTIDLVDPY